MHAMTKAVSSEEREKGYWTASGRHAQRNIWDGSETLSFGISIQRTNYSLVEGTTMRSHSMIQVTDVAASVLVSDTNNIVMQITSLHSDSRRRSIELNRLKKNTKLLSTTYLQFPWTAG